MKKIFSVYMMLVLFTVPELKSQWQPELRLTNELSATGLSINNSRSVAGSGAILHIVWQDGRNGSPGEIYYKRSTDGGSSWSGDIRLTNDPAASEVPTVAVNGNDVFVVWLDNRHGNPAEIYYKHSIDGGLSWTADTRLTFSMGGAYNPSVSISGGNLHVVWHDYRHSNYEIYYKGSQNNGLSWGTDKRITNNSASSFYPSVASTGNIVFIVWQDGRFGNDEILFKSSPDNGNNWGSDTSAIRLTNAAGFSWAPTISAEDGKVHVAWRDDRDGNYEIYYKRSNNNGSDWSADKRLTNNSAWSSSPSVYSSGNNVHVVWEDQMFSSPEILYRRSSDKGSSWGNDSAITRLTTNPADKLNPCIFVSGNAAHVIWRDRRNLNFEIYYKRSLNTNFSLYSKQNLNKPIYDYQNIFDTIIVPNDNPAGYTAEINLMIDTVMHSNTGDLEFTLIHQGISDTVIYQSGGIGDNFIGTVLDDDSQNPVSGGTAPFTGTYKPFKPLSQFINSNPAGLWILKVYDRAAGNTGFFKAWGLTIDISNNPIGINSISAEVPQRFSLKQNYPNPFNPVTNINFSIPKTGLVKLTVYDAAGKITAELFNGELEAGTYNYDFDASQLASGIYFYKLESNDFSQTKKMVLIK